MSSKTPKRITNAAKGETCTLAIPTSCNGDPQTVVYCHFPDGTGGSNRLTGPLSGGFGCSNCHDVIDGRLQNPYVDDEDREFYMRRSQTRTINRLIEKGLVKVRGLT